MNPETIRKLNELKLFGMVSKLQELATNPKSSQHTTEEVLAFLVDAEYNHRKNKKVTRLLQNAKIKLTMACLEDVAYSAKRNLKKDQFRDLCSCDFLKNNQNILISGPTGTGKTYLACALANLACRNGHPTLYTRISRLLEQYKTDRLTGNQLKTLDKLSKTKLLILDDLGPDIFSKEERNIFFEIIEDRYLAASTIITSQLPFDQWYHLFEDSTTADAICDRLFHNAHTISIQGESMRKK